MEKFKVYFQIVGSDIDEAVEVVAPSGMTSEQLSQITFSKYNGSNGTVYGSSALDGLLLGKQLMV